MSLANSNQNSMSRRERQTLRHVSRYWFPLNKPTCARVKEGFARQAYDLDRNSLIIELEEDFALYSLVCRHLSAEKRWKNPIEALNYAPLENIRSAVEKATETFTHELPCEEGERLQELGVSVLANQITKTCARKLGLDERMAHAVSLFRLLGMLLVHWNYSSLMTRRPSHQSSEEFASQELGFSSGMLGALFAKEWGFDDTFCQLIDGEATAHSHMFADIRTLCEAGEALAKANTPDLYPSIPQNFGEAQKFLSERLGSGYLEVIRKELGKARLDYEQSLENFSFRFLDLDIVNKRERSEHVLGQIPIAERVSKSLSLQVRSQIEILYKEWRPGQVSQPAVRCILKEILPACGCLRGSVLILDPSSMMLIPRVLIGASRLSDFGTIDYAPTTGSDSLIASAFRSYSLMTQGDLPREEGRCVSFALGLGKEKRAGVLYVEFRTSAAPAPEVIKALRDNLSDFLGLV